MRLQTVTPITTVLGALSELIGHGHDNTAGTRYNDLLHDNADMICSTTTLTSIAC